ncbi:hypothetical protein N0V88_004044 [Collariella sp. IMI 366227]|nr:hypothetical protein N0V88_004044 [Collariella sp. IMI 366227]
MATWGLLDDKEENELHKSRLLNVEEKPFKRITKRLNTLHSYTPRGDGASPPQAAPDPLSLSLPQHREDITLDFAAFDSSIARLQFLLTANERERERYAAERERIVATSQSVRDSTTALRTQLEDARATLARRRAFDELADAITANPALRPRADQAAGLCKLQEEIGELEAEREAYGVTWNERREQFARIMEESMRLRRLIRDEKEESPAPSAADGRSFVSARRAEVSFSQVGSQMGSREGSVEHEDELKSVRGEGEEGEDVEMGETKDDVSEPSSPLSPPPADDMPQIVVDEQPDSMDTT